MVGKTNRAEKRAAEREGKRLSQRLKQQGAVDLKSPQMDMAPPKTVAFGYTWDEARGVSGYWHRSILSMLQGLSGRVGFRPIGREGADLNDLVRTFLSNEGDDYLLLMDPYVVFQAEDVALLLEADAAIAGATVYDAAPGGTLRCTALVPDGENPDGTPVGYVPWVAPDNPPQPARKEGFDSDEEAEADLQQQVADYVAALGSDTYGPQPVSSIGMHLTLIKREVLVQIAEIYGLPFEAVPGQSAEAEFCRRAAEFDHKTVVVPKARIGHVMATVV